LASFPRLTIRLQVPVSTKRKSDKSERHQNGAGYHQPMRILQGRERLSFSRRLQPDLDQPADGFGSTWRVILPTIRELEQEVGNDEPEGHEEPCLGSFDRKTNQEKSWRTVDRNPDL
jgi:hypothetical protein